MNASHRSNELIRLHNDFNSKEMDDPEVDGAALIIIANAERSLEHTSFDGIQDIVARLKVIKAYGERPDFADPFCNRLFEQMIAAV